MKPTHKPAFRSRTLLVFGLLLLLFILALAFHLLGIVDMTGEVLSGALTGLFVAVIGFAMRLVTSQPIGRAKPEGDEGPVDG